MPGLYFGSVKLASAEDVQDGDMDITGIYTGGTQIFPDDDGPYTLKGDINDNVTGGTPSPELYNIQGEKGDTGTFVVTVDANTNYTLVPSQITGVSGITRGDITAPTSWTQSGTSVVGTFSYEFPESGYGLNRTRTDNFTIDGAGTFVPPTYTFTINFVDNTGDNMDFSTTAISITGEAGVSLNGSRSVTFDNGYAVKTLTATDNSFVLATSDDNVSTVSWTGNMPVNGGSAIITVGGSAQLLAKSFSGTVTNLIEGANVTSSYSMSGLPGSTQTDVLTITAQPQKRLLTNIKVTGINQSNSNILTQGPLVETQTVLNGEAVTQYTITLTAVIQNSDRTDNINMFGNTADLVDVAWSEGNEYVGYLASDITKVFYSTNPDSDPPTVTTTAPNTFFTIGTVTYSSGIGSAIINVKESASSGIKNGTVTLTSGLLTDAVSFLVQQAAAPAPDTATTGFFNGYEGDDKPVADITLSPSDTTHDFFVTTNGIWQANIIGDGVQGIYISTTGTSSANGKIRVNRQSNAPSTGSINIRLSPGNDSTEILQQLRVNYTPEN